MGNVEIQIRNAAPQTGFAAAQQNATVGAPTSVQANHIAYQQHLQHLQQQQVQQVQQAQQQAQQQARLHQLGQTIHFPGMHAAAPPLTAPMSRYTAQQIPQSAAASAGSFHGNPQFPPQQSSPAVSEHLNVPVDTTAQEYLMASARQQQGGRIPLVSNVQPYSHAQTWQHLQSAQHPAQPQAPLPEGGAASAEGQEQGPQQNQPQLGRSMPPTDNSPAQTLRDFWGKLQDMQSRYKDRLHALLPIMLRMQERRPPSQQEAFKKSLGRCVAILNQQPSSQIPQGLSKEVLEKAERFIQHVVSVYSKFLREVVQHSNTGQARRAQLIAQIDNCASAVPPPTRQLSNHQDSREACVMPQPTSPYRMASPNLSQGSAIHPDAPQELHKGHNQVPGQMKALHELQQHSLLPQMVPQRTGQDRPQAERQPPSSEVTPSRAHSLQVQGSHGTKTIPMSGTRSVMLQGRPPVQPRAQLQAQAFAYTQEQATAAQAQQYAMFRANAAAVQAKAVPIANASSMTPAHAVTANASRVVEENLEHKNPNEVPKQQVLSGRKRSRKRQARLIKTQPQTQSGPSGGKTARVGVKSALKQERGKSDIQPSTPKTGPALGAVGTSLPPKRPRSSLQQQVQQVEATARHALEQAERLEAYVGRMQKAKSERIKNTVNALRMVSSSPCKIGGNRNGSKRKAEALASPSENDVTNVTSKDGLIASKAVFECSREEGLQLVKRPRRIASSLSLRQMVDAECTAAKKRNRLLMTEVSEEFGQPVVTCVLKIPEIRLPKLVLRVEKGYPRKGGCTYGFERPPIGWVGVLDEIRERFTRALARAPAVNVGVAAVLEDWAMAADTAINGSWLSGDQ